MCRVVHCTISNLLITAVDRFCVHDRWYFTITSLSGMFAVTFSIVFAYVADITTKEDRSAAYGLVSSIIPITL